MDIWAFLNLEGLWGQKKDVGAQDSDDQGGSKATPSPAVAASQVDLESATVQDSNPATDEASARAAEITKIRAIINEKSGFIRSRDLDRFETDNKQYSEEVVRATEELMAAKLQLKNLTGEWVRSDRESRRAEVEVARPDVKSNESRLSLPQTEVQVVTVSGRVVEAAVTVGRADGAPHTRAVAPVMAPPARPDPNAGLLLGLPKQPWEPSYPGGMVHIDDYEAAVAALQSQPRMPKPPRQWSMDYQLTKEDDEQWERDIEAARAGRLQPVFSSPPRRPMMVTPPCSSSPSSSCSSSLGRLSLSPSSSSPARSSCPPSPSSATLSSTPSPASPAAVFGHTLPFSAPSPASKSCWTALHEGFVTAAKSIGAALARIFQGPWGTPTAATCPGVLPQHRSSSPASSAPWSGIKWGRVKAEVSSRGSFWASAAGFFTRQQSTGLAENPCAA